MTAGNAIAQDHQLLLTLLQELQMTKQRELSIWRIGEELKAHLQAEGEMPQGDSAELEAAFTRLEQSDMKETAADFLKAIRRHISATESSIDAQTDERILQRKAQLMHGLDDDFGTAYSRIDWQGRHGGTPMDAVTLLSEDHERVRRLLSDIEQARPEQSALLLTQLEQEVRLHTDAEKELFYPAMREMAESDDERQKVTEAHEEHHTVDILFMEIKQVDPSTEQFKAKLSVLKDMIEHHATAEEQLMFPKAREGFTNEELANLGMEIARLKQELERSHPAMDRGYTQARTAGEAARRMR